MGGRSENSAGQVTEEQSPVGLWGRQDAENWEEVGWGSAPGGAARGPASQMGLGPLCLPPADPSPRIIRGEPGGRKERSQNLEGGRQVAGAGRGPVCQPQVGVPERGGCTCQRQLGWGCGSRPHRALTEGSREAAQVSIPPAPAESAARPGTQPRTPGPRGHLLVLVLAGRKAWPALSMPPPDTTH